MYAENEEKFNKQFEGFENDEVQDRYPNFKHHIAHTNILLWKS